MRKFTVCLLLALLATLGMSGPAQAQVSFGIVAIPDDVPALAADQVLVATGLGTRGGNAGGGSFECNTNVIDPAVLRFSYMGAVVLLGQGQQSHQTVLHSGLLPGFRYSEFSQLISGPTSCTFAGTTYRIYRVTAVARHPT